MNRKIAVSFAVVMASVGFTDVAMADNDQVVRSEKSARSAKSPEAMYNNIIDRANRRGRASEKIPFIGRFLPGYKQGSRGSRQILEDSKFD